MDKYLIRVFFKWASGTEDCYLANLDLIASTGMGGTWFVHNKNYAFRFPTEDTARVVCELLAKGERPSNSEKVFELVDDEKSRVIGLYRFLNEGKARE